MAIKINNTTISSGNKVNYNGVQKTKVNYNGNEVYVYDSTGPIITVTSDSGYISSSTYTLEGTVTDLYSGIKSLKIDGVSVSISSGGAFSKTFTIDGQKTFTIVAVDNAGNSSTVYHTVNYDNTGHRAELSDTLIKNISTNHTHNHTNGKDWDNSAKVYKYYIESKTIGTYEGLGLWAEATATYNATIDLTILPNYRYIKRVVVGRYGRGTTTINIDENQTSVSVSDYQRAEASNSYFPHGPGERWGVTAKAGISSVTYYYSS